MVAELASVRQQMARSGRVRTQEGLVYAGIALSVLGAGGVVGLGIGYESLYEGGGFWYSVYLVPVFVLAGVLTIAGLVLTGRGFVSISSETRRQAEADARLTRLREREHQLLLQLDVITVPSGAVAAIRGAF